MATVNSAVHGTLTASTVATNTLDTPHGAIRVIVRGTAADIFFTVAPGTSAPTAPTVGGSDCYVAPGVVGGSYAVLVPDSAPVTVSVISSGTPGYSVVADAPQLVVER